MVKAPTAIGLIPARAGSKRVANKNTRELGGHPLLAYAVSSAVESGVFGRVVVSTDSQETADIALRYGAEVPFLRPAELAADRSPDIEWIRHTLQTLAVSGERWDVFSILRPTSPFRSADTIRRAWSRFCAVDGADSLRAVEKCSQHPGKMWQVGATFMTPLLDDGGADPPWHSSAYQSLPEVFVQNASLEIAWSRVPLESGSIAGERLIPFLTEGWEGFDINTMEDWLLAELLVSRGTAQLPSVRTT